MISVCITAMLASSDVLAAEPESAPAGSDAQGMAKKLINPISDMVSIPFQYNWENGVGPDEDLRTILNIQPVVPFTLTPKWNLVARWIMPYISQPAAYGSGSGFSDIVFSTFLSPAASSKLIWGAGPVFGLPMTTDPTLGSGKWSAGPTVVGLKMQGPWIYGMLANQLWSIANTSNVDRPDVSQAFFQPFIAYCTPGGVTYTLQSESTANWNAEEGDVWTAPINFLVSKITRLGPFPMSVMGGGGVYVAKPEDGPEWKLRAMFVLILPRTKG